MKNTIKPASTVIVKDSTADTDFPVVFHDENVLHDDTGSLTYNPDNGNLTIKGGNLKVKNASDQLNLSISTTGNIITEKKIGTDDSQEYIDFGTSDEVNIFINNIERLSVTNTGVDITGNSSISGSEITMSNLPTSDPGDAGRLWKNSSGTLMISSGSA